MEQHTNRHNMYHLLLATYCGAIQMWHADNDSVRVTSGSYTFSNYGQSNHAVTVFNVHWLHCGTGICFVHSLRILNGVKLEITSHQYTYGRNQRRYIHMFIKARKTTTIIIIIIICNICTTVNKNKNMTAVNQSVWPKESKDLNAPQCYFVRISIHPPFTLLFILQKVTRT